jgi:RimJ/RimL family protein N-acetyltransferase
VRHNHRLEGHAFAIRPVDLPDAPLLAELRSDPSRSRFLHANTNDPAVQERWLRAYFERPGDFYFAVERLRGGRVEGFVALYDVNDVEGSAEWGRWILRADSLAAAESACLVLRFAFDMLRLRGVVSRTVADNAQVVGFHDRAGIPRSRLLPQHAELGGRRYDSVEHALDRAASAGVLARLDEIAARVAALLARAS